MLRCNNVARRWSNDCNTKQHPRQQKKCCMMLHESLTKIKLYPTSCNIVQHFATGWSNGCNMLRATMLHDVALNVASVWQGLINGLSYYIKLWGSLSLVFLNRSALIWSFSLCTSAAHPSRVGERAGGADGWAQAHDLYHNTHPLINCWQRRTDGRTRKHGA